MCVFTRQRVYLLHICHSGLIKRGHIEVSTALLPYKKKQKKNRQTPTPPPPNKPSEDESLGSQVSIPACLEGRRGFVSHPPFVRVPPVINLDLVNSP